MRDLGHKIDPMNVVFLLAHIMKNAVIDGIYLLTLSKHTITAIKRITMVPDHRKSTAMSH